MALFVNQNSNRTKLQEKLAAELTEKARQKAKAEDFERPDGVTDSNYLKDTKQTTSLAWVWILIVIIAVGLIIWLMMRQS
jgi:Flp pilus assembly protein TadB